MATSYAIILPIGTIAIHPLNREEPLPSRTWMRSCKSRVSREHTKWLGISAGWVTATRLVE